MNPIDRMIVNHANEIEIRESPSLENLWVCFGSAPSHETLTPLTQLIDSGRFELAISTGLEIEEGKLVLEYLIQKTNLITVAEAIAALRDTWAGMGYSVTVSWKDGSRDKIEAIAQGNKSPVWQWD